MEWNRIICDADNLIYRCGFSAEGEPLSHACHSLKLQINRIKEKLECSSIELFIKGRGNFREDIAVSQTYKGNRTGRKPTMYDELRKYLVDVHGAIEVDGMEADDMVSWILYNHQDKDSKVILAAMDKDLWNTPGWHYNYDPRKDSIEYITIEEADKNFMIQLLEGDKSDNILGLPAFADDSIVRYNLSKQGKKGCGKVLARKVLDGLSGMDALNRCWELYWEYGKEQKWFRSTTMKYFREQGQLLWMTRKMDEEGNPIRWEVPKSCDYWMFGDIPKVVETEMELDRIST